MGVTTQLIDLREYDLAFCDGRKDHSTYPPGVARLKADVKAAHGIILGTPEYHGSVSGVLKNALDLMGFDQFEGKMIGLVGVSGGSVGAFHALSSLRTIGRALHAWVIPEQVSVPNAARAFGPDGTVTDDRLRERLHELGRQVARFAFLHTSEQAREFLAMWERAPHNPGA